MTRASDTAKLLGAGATILDGTTISTADNTDSLTLLSTDADANVGPNLNLYRNSGSPADNDVLGLIIYNGRNDNSQDVIYARQLSYIKDASDGTEDGQLTLQTMVAGTIRDRLNINPTEIVLNEDSQDLDFRVESNGNANMLFVDGGNDKIGVGTNAPARQFTLQNTIANAGGELGLLSSDSDTSGTFGTIHFGNNTDTSLASIRAKADGSTTAGKLEFNTEPNGGAIETRMTITSAGKVGINIASPAGVLDLEKSDGAVGTEASPHLQIASGSTRGYTGKHFLDDTAYYIGQNSALRQLRLYSGAESAGVVMGNGATSFSAFSDERLKEDIEPISNGLQKLADLRCISYRLKDVDADDSQKKLGIIAQDLVGKVDEVIDLAKRKDDETEYMSVRYTEMIPVLIKAIQELKTELDNAKARITALES